nr:probable gluconokinase isoform X1 [Nothobranchius furzeri]XP_054587501.1 probable gluconokinase isoform X1 [Nothobranchius furzeri]XP_054587502.1 probable gluconokinase isoform X1 [Nothobranchius furzeri]XP_054587503.1 probable gluconokinase isoform X1 [Nothobranchius furzeri]
MIYIIMGVSGTGKTTLGTFLSDKLGWPFHEGDDFHPPENIEKMARGVPLTDQNNTSLEEFCVVELLMLTVLRCFLDTKPTTAFPIASQDGFPWLFRLHEIIKRERCCGSDALVACSALKRLYRQILRHGSTVLTPPSTCPRPHVSPPLDVFFIYLHGSYDFIHQRLAARRGHYMKADLLRSQFDILEPPSEEENFLSLDVGRSISDMAGEVEKHVLSLKHQQQ